MLKRQSFGHLMEELTGKDPDTGKDWRQEEKGMTEDEVVGWHHWLNGYEFEQAPGDGEGQGSLMCFIGSQRVGYNWATEQQQKEYVTVTWPECDCQESKVRNYLSAIWTNCRGKALWEILELQSKQIKCSTKCWTASCSLYSLCD